MRTGRSTRGAAARGTSRLLTLAIGSAAVLGLLAAVPAGQAVAAATPGWAALNAPIPANGLTSGQSGSDAVSCAAPGSCVSVGEYYVGAQSMLDADTLSNGVWTSVQIPLPANALPSYQPYFRTLQCPSTTWCTAYGYYEDSAANGQAFASTWASGAWTTTELPLPPAAASPNVSTFDFGLACSQVGSCVAIGTYSKTTSAGSSFVDTLSGGTWSSVEAPAPAGALPAPDVGARAVACASATSCTVVGTYSDSVSTSAGLLDTLSGGTWSATKAPTPPGAAADPGVNLAAVSCPAAGGCVAVGDYTTADTHTHTVVEAEAGSTWAAETITPPADASPSGGLQSPYDDLFDISCPTTQWCEAVGDYAPNSAFTAAPMTATLAGGTWTTGSAPGLVAADTDGYLAYVSCSWPGSCAATGSVSTDNDMNRTTLIDTLAGGTWTGNNAVLPAGSLPSSFNEVYAPSCTGGGCLAGGGYLQSGNYTGFLTTYSNLSGYQEVAADGGLFAFGTPFYGSMGGQHLNASIVGLAVQPDTGGYYEVASDGGLFAFGTPFYGSMGGQHLNAPVVGIAFDSRTGGYYEVASDGGIFAFNAPFLGSMGGQHLNSPIVGIAFDGATGGYYEVASDGGLFAFGAPFQGSMGGQHLNKPVVGMTVDPATGGYYEVASDGGLFAFGAPFQGSMGGTQLAKAMVGMAFDTATGGYYEVASDGGLFAFGAPFLGSMGGQHLNQPVVGMAFG